MEGRCGLTVLIPIESCLILGELPGQDYNIRVYKVQAQGGEVEYWSIIAQSCEPNETWQLQVDYRGNRELSNACLIVVCMPHAHWECAIIMTFLRTISYATDLERSRALLIGRTVSIRWAIAATSLAHLSPQRFPTDPGSTIMEGRPSARRVWMWKDGGPVRNMSHSIRLLYVRAVFTWELLRDVWLVILRGELLRDCLLALLRGVCI